MRQHLKHKFHNQKGLSLVEVLIGLTIISLIMLTIIQFSQGTQETAYRITKEDKELMQVETAMSRFEWDISQIYTPLYFSHAMKPSQMTEAEGEAYNRIIDYYSRNSRFSTVSFDGIPIPLFQNPEKSEFIFFTMSNRRKFQDIKQSHLAWVKYSLVPDDDETFVGEEKKEGTFKLIRNFKADDIFAIENIEWDRIKDQVLMRKVLNLEFEFWNRETQKFTDNLTIIKDGPNIIHAVKVTLKYLDPDNFERITQRIFRPLFPDFTPEDMYRFLRPRTTTGTGGAAGGATGGTTGGAASGQ